MTGLFDLTGKVAVVTGGSRGIGRMIAEGLVRAGVRTYVSSRKADELAATAADLDALRDDVDCLAIPADLGTPDGPASLAAAIAQREDAVHILVNNAGATWGQDFGTFPAEAFDRVLDVNVRGVFLLTQSLAPQLRAAATADDPARVINIGSVDGIHAPKMTNFSYSASKAAVHQLTRHLGAVLADDDITVNAIAPGFFPSKMTAFFGDEGLAAIAAATPRKRVGTPEDIVGAVTFLSSRAGAFVTGVILPVDGGLATLR